MNLSTLKSLQSRIREATGADRELDLAIHKAFVNPKPEWPVRHYTTDPDGLGACVGLMQKVLPGWPGSVSWNGLETKGGTSFAYVHTPIGYDGPTPWPEGSLHHNNTCLALLYSIVSAVIAREEAKLTEKAG